MKAWLVHDWCTPDDMQWADLPLPQPGPGQVRVKVAAAALNFLDTLMIGGRSTAAGTRDRSAASTQAYSAKAP